MTREKKVYVYEDFSLLKHFLFLYTFPNQEQKKKRSNAEDARIGVKGLRETLCNTEY